MRIILVGLNIAALVYYKGQLALGLVRTLLDGGPRIDSEHQRR